MRRKRALCLGLMIVLKVLFIIYTMVMVIHSNFLNKYHEAVGSLKVSLIGGNDMNLQMKATSSEEKKDLEKAKEYIKFYNLTVPYNANFRCVTMKTNPATPVCIYDQYSDMYISHDLEFTGLWEPHVMTDLQEALLRDKSLGLIDIGSNIGVYSLLAAKMGRKVIAVEPNRESLMRMHRAAALAGTTNLITALQNAVSDVRGVATLRLSGNNQGDTRIRKNYEPCIGSCPQKVNMTLLDDLRFVVPTDRMVLKIDAQGYEHLAFKHIGKLLDSIYIPYIYMEWMLMAEHSNTGNHNIKDKRVIGTNIVENKRDTEAMINLLLRRHYRPYKLNSAGGHELAVTEWWNWPTDIVWCHLPSKKEYTKLMRNHFLRWP